MRKLAMVLIWFCFVSAAFGQEISGMLADLTKPHDYVLKRVLELGSHRWQRRHAEDRCGRDLHGF